MTDAKKRRAANMVPIRELCVDLETIVSDFQIKQALYGASLASVVHRSIEALSSTHAHAVMQIAQVVILHGGDKDRYLASVDEEIGRFNALLRREVDAHWDAAKRIHALVKPPKGGTEI